MKGDKLMNNGLAFISYTLAAMGGLALTIITIKNNEENIYE